MNSLTARLKEWAAKPFTSDMDLVAWVLFTLLVTTVAYAWWDILKRHGPDLP